MSDGAVRSHAQEFDQVVSTSTAPLWPISGALVAGPCRMVGPVLARAGRDHAAKVTCKDQRGQNQELAARFGIMSIPRDHVQRGRPQEPNWWRARAEGLARKSSVGLMSAYDLKCPRRLRISRWFVRAPSRTKRMCPDCARVR